MSLSVSSSSSSSSGTSSSSSSSSAAVTHSSIEFHYNEIRYKISAPLPRLPVLKVKSEKYRKNTAEHRTEPGNLPYEPPAAKRDSPLSGSADSLLKASNKAKMALQHVFSSRGLQPWNASSERAIDVVHSVRMGQHPEGGAASCLPLVRICQQVLCDTPPASATCAFIKPVLSGAKPACLDEELSASDSYQDEHWERRVS
jgi:hypothetical protein